jgi:hypothetical protein
MTECVGADFILTANDKGITVKNNEQGIVCGEMFKWEEIEHLIEEHYTRKENIIKGRCKDCKNFIFADDVAWCNNTQYVKLPSSYCDEWEAKQ